MDEREEEDLPSQSLMGKAKGEERKEREDGSQERKLQNVYGATLVDIFFSFFTCT